MDGLHAKRQRDHSLDLVGERADLTVVATRRDDERVEGVDQFAQVEHDRVLADFSSAAPTAAFTTVVT